MTDGATGRETPGAACPNCGDASPGNYCPTCGQRRIERRVTLRRMIGEAVEDQLSLNATLPRTLKALLLHPGFLSSEYVAGRIQRYVPPFRLYLVSSLLFFLVLSFVTHADGLQFRVNGTPVDSVGVAPPAAPAPQAEPLRPGGRPADTSVVAVPAGDRARVDSAAVAELLRGEDWAGKIRFRSPVAVLDSTVNRKLRQFSGTTPRAALLTILAEAVRRAPTAMFLLLPLFAALLKVLYARRGRYYVEHFVFGLHTHAFSFLLLIVLLLLDSWIEVLLMLWMLIYYYVAMKRFYRQGWFRTLVKYALLSFSYMIAFSLVMVGLFVVALLTV